ncbi:hypothetical protein LCGC14_0382440 [marine sediment metagenome]|uniref:Uncharacterized protein n=1 Tax=marine sediment metagenome TaxID=412755 RepID=A0A0F9T1Q5_9ZZZZ
MRLFGFFRKKPVEFEEYYKEQINRIRRGEPIVWLPGTPKEILRSSAEIDRLNAKLDERISH